jgi:magnesium transporter
VINTLYLPELREMLREQNAEELHEFCEAIHPARAAEFMEGLTAEEAWQVLQHASPEPRVQIFGYLDPDKQVKILETGDRQEVGQLVAELPADDRVDLLSQVDPQVVEETLPLVPAEERRDILRLGAYPEGTAGAVMTSEIPRLPETATIGTAFEEIKKKAADWETIYYLYVVDDANHLRGVVTARQLLANVGRPDRLISDLMERDVISVDADDDQEHVAARVAQYDLHAIPVVDHEHHLLGIITHDDVIDVVREEAVEDAHRIAGVEPLDEGYLDIHLLKLVRHRGVWLTILFFTGLLTAFALRTYEDRLEKVVWLAWFIPLIVSTGGNCGNQSASLVITALALGDVHLGDWWRIVRRELVVGLLLGGFLSVIAYLITLILTHEPVSGMVVPVTILLVVVCGTLVGSILPLVFKRLGLDPALMSNPFVAGIIDIAGIVIYMICAAGIVAELRAGLG